MNQVQNDEVRQHVRNRYKQIAIQDVSNASCCSPSTSSSSCCDGVNEISSKLGYSDEARKDLTSGLVAEILKPLRRLRTGKLFLIWGAVLVSIVFSPPNK